MLSAFLTSGMLKELLSLVIEYPYKQPIVRVPAFIPA